MDIKEEIVLQILSHLPTKGAIEASLVCPEWRNYWKKIPVVDFRHWQGDPSLPDERDHPVADSFENFVDILLQTRDKGSLKIFYLGRTLSLCQEKIKTWIATVTGDDFRVEELIIDAFFKRKPIVLPDSIFRPRSSLTRLELRMNTVIDLCKPVNFDKIKILRLSRVKFSGDMRVRKWQELVCPALEELTMCCFRVEEMSALSIKAASLKRLVISGIGRESGVPTFDPNDFYDYDSDDDDVDVDSDDDHIHFGLPTSRDIESGLSNVVLNIYAPNLEYFRFTEEFPADFELDNGESVEAAEIGCFNRGKEKWVRGSYKLLNGLQNVKHLVLNYDTLEAISVSEYGLELPMFHKLNHVEVAERFNCELHRSLFRLIELAPGLSSLVFARAFIPLKDDKVKDFYPWKALTAPKSVFGHLRFVEFREFSRDPAVLKMIESLLRDANNLERMTIYPSYEESMEEHILNLPRASKSCVINFPFCSFVPDDLTSSGPSS
ncbi:F-box domain [Macleaya cordata]|uniref:F-box domain n=1 Tax=Macleaya cordata TaxID=56857 RepID=A0A200QBD2_MACCD|nr:F-box domain [Macleaya cordata]